MSADAHDTVEPVGTQGRGRWLGLAVLSLGVSIIIVDATVVNVALPTIIRDLQLGLSGAEWVNSIYSLVFAALLIATGRFADLRGRVVLVTGVYAACTTACPEIFLELKKILAELPAPDRSSLSVVALSLNPEYETSALMNLIAEGRGLAYPEFRYANAPKPAAMHDALTRLQFSATRNPQTGVIDHANLFLLVDRSGHIAYRFTLDPRHRAWLRAGLRALLLEPNVIPRAS